VDYRDGTGRRRWVTCESREEADAVLSAKIMESRQAAPVIRDRRTTVKEYSEHWLKSLAGQIRPRTLTGYSDILKRYIIPDLGSYKLVKIHVDHIKELLSRRRAEGLSKNTVRLIRATFSVMLGDAVEDHFLATNAARELAPRGRRKQPGTISSAERRRKIMP